MTLPRAEVEDGLLEELHQLADLVEPLTADELATPTRCESWTVSDVVGHVCGTLSRIVRGELDGLATPEVTGLEAAARRGRNGSELAEELRTSADGLVSVIRSLDDAVWEGPGPTGVAETLGGAVETLWFDAYIHCDDVRHALGRPSEPTGGLVGSVSHLAQELTLKGWTPATLRFETMPAFDVSGGGLTIGGDSMAFVLAATGRIDPSAIGLDESVDVIAWRLSQRELPAG